MGWLLVLPTIIDVLRAALKLVDQMQDSEARREAKDELRDTLQDYSKHLDPQTLKSNLEQFSHGLSGNGGSRR